MLIFKGLENSLVFPGMKAAEGWSEPSDPATHDCDLPRGTQFTGGVPNGKKSPVAELAVVLMR